MVNYYSLIRDQIMYRFRSDIRKKILDKRLKTEADIIYYAADYISQSMVRRGLVTVEEAQEALLRVDPDEVIQKVKKHCAISNNIPVIEKAIMKEFGEDREDVSKSILLYLLILKVVVSIIVIWWWQKHKKGEVLYYGRGIQAKAWRKNNSKVLKQDVSGEQE